MTGLFLLVINAISYTINTYRGVLPKAEAISFYGLCVCVFVYSCLCVVVRVCLCVCIGRVSVLVCVCLCNLFGCNQSLINRVKHNE